MINALRNTYSLKELLVAVNMAKSSCCYQDKALAAPDKYEGAREHIRKTFTESYESSGYRWIYECVKKDDGSNYSGKEIRRIMAEELPIVHSDRGCHYRWLGWIERMENAGLTRSMSKKGYSPDNSACEGFFGRLNNEVFYNRSWDKVSINEIHQ